MDTHLVPAAPVGELSTARHDRRDDWPDEARALRDDLTEIYGADDPLPTLAGGWIAAEVREHPQGIRPPVPRLGGVQPEVWKHLRVLARKAGIPQADSFTESLPTFAEYDCVSGSVLVRVSHFLTPTQAADYETAAAKPG